jgi:hypothetical protein
LFVSKCVCYGLRRARVGRTVDELWVAGEIVGRELAKLSVVGVRVSGMGLLEKRLALC